MPAARKIAQGQLECLVGWMQSNPLVARGAFLNTPQGKQRAGALWEELASRLNAMPVGCTKSAKEWRQYWGDLKCKVKKKGAAIRQHGGGTGGGPPCGILTPLEERILCIIGVQNVTGIESVRIPFDMGDDVLELEKRRVALEERRLALEERRLEQKQRFEERWLALEERRFEDEQRWRHDILDTLKGIAETLF
ncbi:uncharacterized protein [Epargyreus clarus]|uniref:uncharacterized protein isoform X1 n=1 Tax=Epargyreus clarus TaxID=520877 RepID=UPI003C3012D7